MAIPLGKCLSRVIDQWHPLLSFFREEVDGNKYKIPISIKSYKKPQIKMLEKMKKKKFKF